MKDVYIMTNREKRLLNEKVTTHGEPISADARAAIYLRWLAGGESNIKAYARSVCERALELDRAKAAKQD